MATNKAWQECLDEAKQEWIDKPYNPSLVHQLAAEKYAVRFLDWIDITEYSPESPDDLHQRFIEENNNQHPTK